MKIEKPYLLLKFGDIKGGDFRDNPDALKLYEELDSMNDDHQYKNKCLEIIDCFNGEFLIWWGEKKVNKETAKKYIQEY